ncbi:PmoA family protein [Maribacter confluentis]|uniref:PmoA family protein n=1 Tax=Maribacter confluentis TaxID=1656093 RepID=A0ABT8RT47_9FLAO|nr:PmoA family protein [Maribacter confluentis]MDO1513286.1 PmoA family protein [Maribacter confluentis]
MYRIKYSVLLFTLVVLSSCKEQQNKGTSENISDKVNVQDPVVTFEHDKAAKKVKVSLDGTLFTNYIYDGKTPKPILYPVLTLSGKTLTRGFPFEPRPGERIDHPHHAGLWFNYGDVNGLDFWNNSYAIPDAEKDKYGGIVHDEFLEMDEDKGVLKVKAFWQTSTNENLLEETTQLTFAQVGNTRIIDRNTTLKALKDIAFNDNKEGMIGIRVAREMEMPTDKPAEFTDADGNITKVKVLNNDGVEGNYISSSGLTGNKVWGTRNEWVKLESKLENEQVSITIIDHEDNVGFPTYWHARDYGLFAANPLGQAVFSDGKESLNFKLKEGESTTFKYRILIHNGSALTPEEITKLFTDFNQ